MNDHQLPSTDKKTILLSEPQFEFVQSREKHPAFVAGFGSGKTTAAVARCMGLMYEICSYGVSARLAYYLPTYSLIKLIAYPAFEEVLLDLGLEYRINKSDNVIYVAGMGEVILRTMDNPERIVGYQVHDSVLDEMDILTLEKAKAVWQKVIARNRLKKPNGLINTVAIATTPEGYKFVYQKFKRKPIAGAHLVQASTYSNYKNLPSDYIESLADNYEPQMFEAYINGQFVNLTSGCVYSAFDRTKHTAPLPLKDKNGEVINQQQETLHIGMDFNVGKMAALIAVLRDNKLHGIGEITKKLDTPAMIAEIKRRYPLRHVIIYPDASGKNRKTNDASTSDIKLLKSAGFTVLVRSKNPFVRDRIIAVNKALRDGKLVLSPDTCTETIESLEQQTYNEKGEPDKANDYDHLADGLGYMVYHRFPVVLNSRPQQKLKGT